MALVEAAHAAGRSKGTYLGSHYHRIRGRRGPARASVAVGHSILVIIWNLLSTGEIYTDLGADYFEKRRSSDTYQRQLVHNSKHSASKSPSNQQQHNHPALAATPPRGYAPKPTRPKTPPNVYSHVSSWSVSIAPERARICAASSEVPSQSVSTPTLSSPRCRGDPCTPLSRVENR